MHPLAALLGTLWPAPCLHCGDPNGGSPLCAPCHTLAPLPERWRVATLQGETWAAHRYEGPLRSIVRAVKYGGRHEGWGTLLRWMERGVPMALMDDPPDWVVPIPGHRHRVNARGLDLAGALGRRVSRALRRPLRRGALERARLTPPQASLDPVRRRANVEGAFRCDRPLLGADVLVVDDVTTTGATLDAAEEVLSSAGAGRVRRLVLAHPLKRNLIT